MSIPSRSRKLKNKSKISKLVLPPQVSSLADDKSFIFRIDDTAMQTFLRNEISQDLQTEDPMLVHKLQVSDGSKSNYHKQELFESEELVMKGVNTTPSTPMVRKSSIQFNMFDNNFTELKCDSAHLSKQSNVAMYHQLKEKVR